MKIKRNINWTFFYLLVAMVVGSCIGPLIWQFITSLKADQELAKLPPLLPHAPTIKHYFSIFLKQRFEQIILNSAIVASATTIFSIVVGVLTSYAIAKLEFRGKNIILALFLSVSMFPQIAIISPLFVFLKTLGLRDTYSALVFPYTSFALPLTIWILTNFFREIPDEILKSAKVDGCGLIRSLKEIIFPLALPGIFTTAILVFIFAWNEFLFALTFTSTPKAQTIPVGIALFPGLHENPWGEICAASIVVTIPLVILVLICQRRIISGLTAGAVKG